MQDAPAPGVAALRLAAEGPEETNVQDGGSDVQPTPSAPAEASAAEAAEQLNS